MANIWFILLVTILTVPSVLMSKVSNQTQRLHSTENSVVTDCPGSTGDEQVYNFLQYFIGRKMPTGLFNFGDQAVVYLCQTNSVQTFSYYSTIFDKTSMNAILSAYSITTEQALLIGEADRSNYWRSIHKGHGHGGLFSRTQYEDLYHSTDAANYQKGHLLPFSIYSFHENYGKSTFDYSNAVPQRADWNQGVWKSFEKAVKRYTQLTCGCRYRGTMYLLTGTSHFAYVKSSSKLIQVWPVFRLNKKITYTSPTDHIKRSITIPNVMWTAGCCIGSDPQSGEEKVQSIAVIGNNHPTETFTTAITVTELQHMLADHSAKKPVPDVNLFPDQAACSFPGNSYILNVKSQ